MANYFQRKKPSWAGLVATVLAVLLAVSVVLGLGFNLGWFEKSDEIEDTDAVETEDTDTSTQNTSEDIVYEFEAE